MKRLKDLFLNIPFLEMKLPEKEVSHLTASSQEVVPGSLFVAYKGLRHDGHDFIPKVLKKGVSAIVAEKSLSLPPDIGWVRVKDSQGLQGPLAANFYDHPAQKLVCIGITGTNGKTSSAWFVREMLQKIGVNTGLLGTIYYCLGSKTLPAKETTPPALRLQAFLKQMLEANLSHMVMEVSSHALDQRRVEGIKFQVAAFLNLSRDHLDYHKDMFSYFSAKKRLFFRYLSPKGKAVINIDDPWGERLAQQLSLEKLTIGRKGNLKGRIISRSFRGFVFEIRYKQEIFKIPTKLVGDFQLENLLLALGIGLSLGIPISELIDSLKDISAPPGRLELIGEYQGGQVFVDYAHTPKALDKVLESLFPLVSKELICLFGCGGERDKGKRPLMGEIASKWAHRLIITSDNPRGEEPQEIICDILKGIKEKDRLLVIPDRKEAIIKALNLLKPGSILLIAGKGHENYQEIKGFRYPFSDRDLVKDLLTKEAA